ncbi:MAG: flippase-like domain-containing protein [Candidatus Dormibacteraeota bacterium]|nr:flippase-like domain-containing protein [Candidatus Dormibacteraeota bacterium]MBV8445323.1 flippase-like domain-containing protein [Candidatus Dormibacteraeota bacterium]
MPTALLARTRRLLGSPWLRVAGTLGGIAVLVHTVDIPKAVASLGHADPRWILAFLGLSTVAVLASVVEWGVLIRTAVAHAPDHPALFGWRRLGSAYLQSLFFTQVIPAGVGGDALRTVEMGKHVGHSRVLASLAGSRMAGMLGMAIWGLAAAVVLRALLGTGTLMAVAGLAAGIVMIWLTALSSDRLHLHQAAGRVSQALGRALHSFTDAFASYRRHPHAVAQSLLVGAAGWGINLFALEIAARAVGIDLSWTVFAVAVPLTLLAALAPFSVNGLGVREGVLVYFLAHYAGITAAHAGAISLLIDLQMVPFAVIGAALWLRHRRTATAAPLRTPALAAATS